MNEFNSTYVETLRLGMPLRDNTTNDVVAADSCSSVIWNIVRRCRSMKQAVQAILDQRQKVSVQLFKCNGQVFECIFV